MVVAPLININLQPSNNNPNRPSSANVVDWELALVAVVPVGEARPETVVGLLGLAQAVDDPRVGNRPARTQAIDWFAAIAEQLPAWLAGAGE